MRILPRVALGTVHPGVDGRPLLWALLQRLEQSGVQTQCFTTQSRFPQVDGATPITGRAYRHLDGRLMSSDVCREVFENGMLGADLAIVENVAAGDSASLDPIAQWLQLPRILVIDAQADPCQLPVRPPHIDGILLTNAADQQQFTAQRLRWEALWNAPVLGGLVGAAHVCAILERLPAGSRPSQELVRALNSALVLTRDVNPLLEIAGPANWTTSRHVFGESRALEGLRVAVAFDDAFHEYFPDTLDLLERNGAQLRDFSPLADADLPPETDVVYLGCGHVERFAEALAANPCMIAALRRHARSGGRIYAEGGGAAYLCQQMEFDPLDSDSREIFQMCGIIPAVARHTTSLPAAELVEVALANDCWLGERGEVLRGYRNGQWRMEPMGPHWSLGGNPSARTLTSHSEMLCRDNVIASQVHLNLVAQPHLLSSFVAAANAPLFR